MKNQKKIMELLGQVKDFMLAHPENYMQNVFICGSAACIAGMMGAILTGRPEDEDGCLEAVLQLLEVKNLRDVWLLGLTSDWPSDLQVAYEASATPQSRVAAALAAMDRYTLELEAAAAELELVGAEC